MRILVTGGAGFVGTNLIELLSKNKDLDIICLDNYFTGNKKKISGVKYLEGSTKDIFSFENQIGSPEIVYHLGEYSRIATSFEDIRKVWDLNSLGTFEVLEYCKEKGSKIIYAGSSSKFGNNGEDENLSPYAWIKSKNVELIKNYNKWFGVEYAIAYLYNVYGDGQISKGKYATVVGIFLDQFLNSKPLTVVSPGSQKRYFTHIDDVVLGLKMIGEHGHGDNYCLCDKNSLFSIMELAKMFSENIETIPSQNGNRVDLQAPSDKCSAELGWSTSKNISDYITKIKGEIK